jgi:hypothetical protein
MIRRLKFPDKTFSNFNHSLKAKNSLIAQSAAEKISQKNPEYLLNY